MDLAQLTRELTFRQENGEPPLRPPFHAARAWMAVHIAADVGEWVWREQGGLLVEAKEKRPNDHKTVLDELAEKRVRELIAQYDPRAVVLGEEQGQQAGDSTRAAVRYVVDPIDGTRAFENGLSDWVVSIAVEERGRVVAAAVYHPGGRPHVRDPRWGGTMYMAALGQGAYVNGERVTMPSKESVEPERFDLNRTTLQFGLTPDPDVQAMQRERVMRLGEKVADVRRGGSAILGITHAARGAVLFNEGPLNHWDIAGALCFAREAGAAVGVRELPYVRNDAPTFEVAVGHPDTFRGFNDLLAGQPPYFGLTAFADEHVTLPDSGLSLE